MQSQPLNRFSEKAAQSFKVPPPLQGHARPGSGLLLGGANPDWLNSRVAAISSLDYYQALIKSMHLPGSQFPVADAGKKGNICTLPTHMSCEAHLQRGHSPNILQPPEAAEIARGHAHTESQAAGLGQSPGPGLCPGQWCALCFHSHAGNLLGPPEDAAGGRYLRLAMILFKMLRSSKAEISASCRKEENKGFECELQTPYHRQPPTPLGELAKFKHPLAAPLDRNASAKLSPPPLPRSATGSRALARRAGGLPEPLGRRGEARAAWGEGRARPSSTTRGTHMPPPNAPKD